MYAHIFLLNLHFTLLYSLYFIFIQYYAKCTYFLALIHAEECAVIDDLSQSYYAASENNVNKLFIINFWSLIIGFKYFCKLVCRILIFMQLNKFDMKK